MAFSVNTNVGGMVALQSFAAARTQLNGVTSHVATGLRVTGAVDNPADFGIAQGLRTDINAWSAVATQLGAAQGLLNVTVAAATQVSNLLGTLRQQVIDYFSATDPTSRRRCKTRSTRRSRISTSRPTARPTAAPTCSPRTRSR